MFNYTWISHASVHILLWVCPDYGVKKSDRPQNLSSTAESSHCSYCVFGMLVIPLCWLAWVSCEPMVSLLCPLCVLLGYCYSPYRTFPCKVPQSFTLSHLFLLANVDMEVPGKTYPGTVAYPDTEDNSASPPSHGTRLNNIITSPLTGWARHPNENKQAADASQVWQKRCFQLESTVLGKRKSIVCRACRGLLPVTHRLVKQSHWQLFLDFWEEYAAPPACYGPHTLVGLHSFHLDTCCFWDCPSALPNASQPTAGIPLTQPGSWWSCIAHDVSPSWDSGNTAWHVQRKGHLPECPA